MILTKEYVAIIEDKPEKLDKNRFSAISTSKNIVDVFTRKRANIMWPTDEEISKFDKIVGLYDFSF